MKHPGFFFRLQRFIAFLFAGIGKQETEYYLFTLTPPWADFDLYCALADSGWQPNPVGYVYKGQIYQCRQLLHRGEHQYHIRCYRGGRVTGHFEVAPEWDTSDHLGGRDLRIMNGDEADKLKKRFTKELV